MANVLDTLSGLGIVVAGAVVHLGLLARRGLEPHERPILTLAPPRPHQLLDLRHTTGIAALPDLGNSRAAFCTPSSQRSRRYARNGSIFQFLGFRSYAPAAGSGTSASSFGPTFSCRLISLTINPL